VKAKNFIAYYFLEVHLHHFSKIKSHKKSQNSRNQEFSYYFSLMKEGSGSVPLTNGAGSGRPKITRIPDGIHNTCVRFYFCQFHGVRIRHANADPGEANQYGSIRIRNTATNHLTLVTQAVTGCYVTGSQQKDFPYE
jgi:hypothetical protein